MQPLRSVRSKTVVLPLTNVDTDQIIPARFLTTTTKEGLGRQLFSDWRYRADGAPNPDFVLNRPEALGCEVLVAGRNFGCGSSREHAPWAILDYGFRAILAPSYADIFYNNCIKNGILPVTLSNEQIDELFRRTEATEGYRLTVDLEKQIVTDERGLRYEFAIEPFRRESLLQGLDEIGLTLAREAEIAAFEAKNLHVPAMHGAVDVKYHKD